MSKIYKSVYPTPEGKHMNGVRDVYITRPNLLWLPFYLVGEVGLGDVQMITNHSKDLEMG